MHPISPFDWACMTMIRLIHALLVLLISLIFGWMLFRRAMCMHRRCHPIADRLFCDPFFFFHLAPYICIPPITILPFTNATLFLYNASSFSLRPLISVESIISIDFYASLISSHFYPTLQTSSVAVHWTATSSGHSLFFISPIRPMLLLPSWSLSYQPFRMMSLVESVLRIGPIQPSVAAVLGCLHHRKVLPKSSHHTASFFPDSVSSFCIPHHSGPPYWRSSFQGTPYDRDQQFPLSPFSPAFRVHPPVTDWMSPTLQCLASVLFLTLSLSADRILA